MGNDEENSLIRERSIRELRRSLKTAVLVLLVVTVLYWNLDRRVALFIPAVGLPSLLSVWLYLRRLVRQREEEIHDTEQIP